MALTMWQLLEAADSANGLNWQPLRVVAACLWHSSNIRPLPIFSFQFSSPEVASPTGHAPAAVSSIDGINNGVYYKEAFRFIILLRQLIANP